MWLFDVCGYVMFVVMCCVWLCDVCVVMSWLWLCDMCGYVIFTPCIYTAVKSGYAMGVVM